MKLKKILALFICVVIILSTAVISVSANGNYVSFNASVNGMWYYENMLIKNGETLTIEVFDVQYGGAMVDESEITYSWYKQNPETFLFEVVAGENSKTFTTVYDGSNYSCFVETDYGSSSRDFNFKADTLTVSGSADKPYTEENTSYIVNPGLVGSSCSLFVDAVSTIPGAEISYVWEQTPYYSYPDEEPEFKTLDNTTNTVEFVTPAGGANFHCTVSDGNTTKYVYFEIMPDKTIDMTNLINGEVPSTYAGTYIYVVKPGEMVTVNLSSTSVYGDVKYTWFYQNEIGMPIRMDHTEGVLEIKKSLPTENNPYASQPFTCFIEDGNEKIRYWIMLFCLDPEQPLSEINKIGNTTPDVEFITDNEDLANNLLTGEELQAMNSFCPTSIELSAERLESIDNTQQESINGELTKTQNIGMHIDINLQKNVMDGTKQITELESDVELGISIPESLINTDKSVNREYKIVRVHNGVSEVLDCDFDSETSTLSFKTDRFSLYTVVYEDLPTGQDTNKDVTILELRKALLNGITEHIYDIDGNGIVNICDLVKLYIS